jgi:hypothetical protein
MNGREQGRRTIAKNNYRIYRVDPKNIAIQKKRENSERWDTISYHGNSVNSLISGLFELIMSQHTPEKENLYETLVDVQLELVRGVQEVKKMVKEYESKNL